MPADPSSFALLATVAAIQLLAVASPGPAFVIVSRAAATRSRAAGLATGLGVAVAALSWATAASLGMHALLERLPWLYRFLQVAGGFYLLWLGARSWRHAAAPLAAPGNKAAPGGLVDAWLEGVKSGLANPKIIVFFGSIFVTLFAPGTPGWVKLAAVAIVPFNEILWYGLVACAFSARPVQAAYRRAKAAIDRVMGSLLGFFGLRLVLGALIRA